mmetsp:Transcript_14589/g.48908  ORF Transcript_14589/g.48908 Transcript_14589/m.48908 type:complete len:486 (-) Transcript_14589:108-1565(-)
MQLLFKIIAGAAQAPFALPVLPCEEKAVFIERVANEAQGSSFGYTTEPKDILFSFVSHKAEDAGEDADVKVKPEAAEAEEVVISGGGSSLPHSRPHCEAFPFASTAHAEACAKCYCFVCDCPISKCPNWDTHCDASDAGPDAQLWKAKRKASTDVGFPEAAKFWLKGVGVDIDFAGNPSPKALGVGKFLNRLLGLRLAQQNLIFDFFAQLVDSVVRAARREGKYDEAIKELSGQRVRVVDDTVLNAGSAAEDRLRLLRVQVDRGILLKSAEATLAQAVEDAKRSAEAHVARPFLDMRRAKPLREMNGFYLSKLPHPISKKRMPILALRAKTFTPGDTSGNVRVYRPGTGISQMQMTDVLQKYQRSDAAAIKPHWDAAYDAADAQCSHGPNCAHGATCQVGRRTQDKFVLAGSLLQSMRTAERAVKNHTGNDMRLSVVRVIETPQADDDDEAAPGVSVIGLELPQLIKDCVVTAIRAHAAHATVTL